MAVFKCNFSPYLIVLLVLICTAIYAAGSSMTFTFSRDAGNNTGMAVLDCLWVTDNSTGEVSGSTDAATTEAIKGMYIVVAITDPADGDLAPDDNYDIVIKEYASTEDTKGVDVMGGALQDRDTSNTEQAIPLFGALSASRAVLDALHYEVTTAGNSNSGTIRLILSRQR